MRLTELADRVWIVPTAPGVPTVTLVAGDAGLVVVDAPSAAVPDVVGAVRALGRGPVTTLVATHEHPDHVAGSARLLEEYADRPATLAHETAAEAMSAAVAPGVVPPDRTFSSAVVLDLGDRSLEVLHPGRAHTAGDLVVRVPDADVVVAGDVVSGGAGGGVSGGAGGAPAYGPDCWPMDWPLAVDVVLQLLTPASVVVPGHGAPLDRGAVEEHRAMLGIVAEMVRDAAARGVPADEALAGSEWPWAREAVAWAVRRGYAQLPRSQRRLPLL